MIELFEQFAEPESPNEAMYRRIDGRVSGPRVLMTLTDRRIWTTYEIAAHVRLKANRVYDALSDYVHRGLVRRFGQERVWRETMHDTYAADLPESGDVDVDTLAECLEVTNETVYKWLANGFLPKPRWIGSHWDGLIEKVWLYKGRTVPVVDGRVFYAEVRATFHVSRSAVQHWFHQGLIPQLIYARRIWTVEELRVALSRMPCKRGTTWGRWQITDEGLRVALRQPEPLRKGGAV